MSTPGVGEDIEDICTRCGDTWHVVMAKVGDRVAKVVCKLCGGQHNYRGDQAAAAPASSGASSSWGRSRKRRITRSNPITSASTVVFDPSKPPRAYSPKEGFLPGERVTHATFGIGVVSGVPGPGKVEIHFPGGLRTLACAKAVSTLERPVAAMDVALPDRPPLPKPRSGNGTGA
ncbi:MAG: hypothetical protein WBP56_16650 [Polyangia bacterium]